MEKPTVNRTLTAAILALALTGTASAQEPVTVNVSKIKDLSLRVYGFIETDLITDSTQSFNEEEGTNLIAPRFTSTGANNFAGQHRRTQMSIRNSRLGFDQIGRASCRERV